LRVWALGGRRLGAQPAREQRLRVLEQALRAEAALPDRHVYDARLLDPELDLTRLDLAHRLGDVEGDGADLGVGHEATRAEDLPQAADHAHHVRGGDGGVEVEPLLVLDLLGHLLRADVVRPGGLRLLGLVAPMRRPYATSRPRLRAVPSTVFTACSRLAAVRSGIFRRAISSTCWRVTCPTFFFPGSAEPFSIPAARFKSTAAGGVLVMKVKDRSAYTVMMTGMMRPACACVWALNALQNSMMLTPRWPSAGPTGGLGFAAPAGICSLISAMTFFMRASRLL